MFHITTCVIILLAAIKCNHDQKQYPRAETDIVCLCICSKGNFISRTKSIRNRPLKPGCTSIIFLLLMLCGDVETNPGPITASTTTDLCGTCNKVVKTGEKALGCEYCNTWFHIVCEKYSEVEYEMLKKPQSHWFCKRCDDKAIDVLQIMRNTKEFQDKMVERIEAVEKKVELVEKVEGPMADRVVEIVQKEIAEERERRIREWNVVIRGMDDVSLREDDEDEKEEEQGAVGGINPPSARMDQQMMTERKVEYLVESGLELPKINITGIRKLRNKDIVIITLGSREEKHKVLDKARSLNRTDMWKNVYVTPDMTRKEQEIDYNLRKELKERREKGEKNLVKRGGRLVTLEPRPKEKPPEPRKYRSRELRSSVRSNTE